MKRVLWLVFLIISPLFAYGNDENDSLLRVLDQVVSERAQYTAQKKLVIENLQQKKARVAQDSLMELYEVNVELFHQYQPFICDSAEQYIRESMAIAEKMNDRGHFLECKLNLALIYSLSGLFVQANDLFLSVDFEKLPDYLKAFYGWHRIRYYENLINYTNDVKFTKDYYDYKEAYRDTVMSILYDQSDEYMKEKVVKLENEGKIKEALSLLTEIYQKKDAGTHEYAMLSMGLAQAYRMDNNAEQEEKYLILAAMTDIRLAVKENEALLSLAIKLYHDGDIDRAYTYIKVALDDATFYNSRFKNTVISRIYPIIEDTYLYRLERQRRNLRFYIFLTTLFVVVLAISLFITYKQIQIVARARHNLKAMNEKLEDLNKTLDEANIVKEKYVGYFMNQCTVYINKLDEYRKNVNRKIRANQVDDLYKSSSRSFEKELDDFYHNFDRAFLQLYPSFVDEFNAMLEPDKHYKVKDNELNTELRIFALIRLGITSAEQIAVCLHCSVQTVYNYKSKVKRMTVVNGNLFEEEVKKLGSLSKKSDSDT